MIDHKELLRNVSEGNMEAFEKLFKEFNKKVFNTALSYIQNVEEAEEITQDVFIEIHHSASKFEGKSSVSTWIFRIAVNKALDHLRYKKRKKRFGFFINLFDPEEKNTAYDFPNYEHPGILLEKKEESKILFEAVEQLPEQQKTAFVMAIIEQIPQKEVAEIMNSSVKAVESLIQRAKVNLRKSLEKSLKPEGKPIKARQNL